MYQEAITNKINESTAHKKQEDLYFICVKCMDLLEDGETDNGSELNNTLSASQSFFILLQFYHE